MIRAGPDGPNETLELLGESRCQIKAKAEVDADPPPGAEIAGRQTQDHSNQSTELTEWFQHIVSEWRGKRKAPSTHEAEKQTGQEHVKERGAVP